VKWQAEGRAITTGKPGYDFRADQAPANHDNSIRAFHTEVIEYAIAGSALVDVGSPAEFSGGRMHMPEYPQENVIGHRTHLRGKQCALGAGG